jgi:hypothetical protein
MYLNSYYLIELIAQQLNKKIAICTDNCFLVAVQQLSNDFRGSCQNKMGILL